MNYVHPFREGNGRTLLQYLKQLAARTGHPLDLTRIEASSWIEASRVSHTVDYSVMTDVIIGALVED